MISLAMLGILIQLAVSYIFNALHKGGATWRDGTAVHYVLHQDRMVTWLGVWARPYMTLLLSKVLSYGSLVVESLLPVLVLSPVYRVVTRRLAMLSVIALHLGFQLAINLGVFSLVMIAYVPFLMTGEDWEALGRWANRHGSIPRLGRRLSSRLLSLAPVARLAARAARRPAPPPPTPAMAFWRRLVAVLREGMVAVMIAVLASELFIGNAILSTRLKFPQPELMKMLVAYPRLIQAWSMFAPDAPTVDETIVVDAVTADGRPTRRPVQPDRRPLPTTCHHRDPGPARQRFVLLQLLVAHPFYPDLLGALQEWILAYPRRTGRAEDRIVSFEVSIVEDDSPPPGETQPREYEIHRLSALEKAGLAPARLPFSLRILLENLLRTEDGRAVKEADIRALASWDPKAEPSKEIAFMPAACCCRTSPASRPSSIWRPCATP